MKNILILILSLAMTGSVWGADLSLTWDYPAGQEKKIDGFRIFQTEIVNGEIVFDYAKPLIFDLWPNGDIRPDVRNVDLTLTGKEDQLTEYAWTARAFSGAEESQDSNVIKYSIDNIRPLAPINVSLKYLEDSDEIVISWDQEEVDDLEFFRVFYRVNDYDQYITFGDLIINPSEEKKSFSFTKKFDSPPQPVRKNVYSFSVVAFKLNGNYSNHSIEAEFTIEKMEVKSPYMLQLVVH